MNNLSNMWQKIQENIIFQILQFVLMGAWTLGGFFIAIIAVKGFQALKLGPFDGGLYSFLVLVVWAIPGLISSCNHAKRLKAKRARA